MVANVTPARGKRRGGIEERKDPRRTVHYPAHIHARDGTPPHRCTLFDVSQKGAKLIAQTIDDIPSEFVLLLGGAYRKCRVVWRKERQMGVQFIT
jgi:PilZ domain